MDGHLRDLATSGWKALDELRADGQIGAVGAGINERGPDHRASWTIGDIDAFLIAMPYTLLAPGGPRRRVPGRVERGCRLRHRRAVPVRASWPRGRGPAPTTTTRRRRPRSRTRVAAIQAVCERHGVPLAAAALQFPLGHPAVASVIPGASSPAQQVRNLETFRHPIPADLWAELKAEGLLRADARSREPAGSSSQPPQANATTVTSDRRTRAMRLRMIRRETASVSSRRPRVLFGSSGMPGPMVVLRVALRM